ncbi:MAG: hypothetical protein U0168_26560 [Nannocystaceae bacterium]
MRPGKPTGLVSLGSALLFALPGNPASTLVAFVLLVRPCLRALAGVADAGALPQLELPLAGEVEGERAREHFVRARLHAGMAMPCPTSARATCARSPGPRCWCGCPRARSGCPPVRAAAACCCPTEARGDRRHRARGRGR